MVEHDRIRSIVERYERPLIQYAISLVGGLEPARDVVQETFIRLSNEDFSRVEGHLAQWLFTVCRNRAIDVRRKEGRLSPMEQEQIEERASGEPSPSAALERKEEAGRMSEMLATLPENQREVIRLKFQQQLSYREISEVTKLSVSNVGFLIHCGVKTLRQMWHQTEGANV